MRQRLSKRDRKVVEGVGAVIWAPAICIGLPVALCVSALPGEWHTRAEFAVYGPTASTAAIEACSYHSSSQHLYNLTNTKIDFLHGHTYRVSGDSQYDEGDGVKHLNCVVLHGEGGTWTLVSVTKS